MRIICSLTKTGKNINPTVTNAMRSRQDRIFNLQNLYRPKTDTNTKSNKSLTSKQESVANS